MKGRAVSFKERGGEGRIGVIASGRRTMSINCAMFRHTLGRSNLIHMSPYLVVIELCTCWATPDWAYLSKHRLSALYACLSVMFGETSGQTVGMTLYRQM